MATAIEKKQIVTAFLEHSNGYANGMLANYRGQLDEATGMDALTLQDKITHWTAHRAFNEYAIEEMKGTRIDDWFTDA